jgi:chromatin remodeling complex protein RSC6
MSQTNSVDDIMTHFENISETIISVKLQINFLKKQISILEKGIKKNMKDLNKEITKNKSKISKKKQVLSGFAKPSKVSKELCMFMNKEEGTEIARTEVTRSLVSYIKEHNLENIDNRKNISPDEKLKTLLGIENDEKVTYFNIQKYMNKHFISETI